MKKLIFLFLTVALIQVILIQQSDQAPPERSCKMIAASFAKRQITGITKCIKSMKFKNGKDKSKKMNCILRCVMIQEELLGPDGQSTPAIYDGFLMKEFPPSLIDRFNGTFANCMTIAYKGFKPIEEDQYCTSYVPFIQCLMGEVPGLCNWN